MSKPLFGVIIDTQIKSEMAKLGLGWGEENDELPEDEMDKYCEIMCDRITDLDKKTKAYYCGYDDGKDVIAVVHPELIPIIKEIYPEFEIQEMYRDSFSWDYTLGHDD